MVAERISRKINPQCDLSHEKRHSLASHFGGAHKRVVGLLDFLAGKNKNRFVFLSIEALARKCARYKGEKYTRSHVWRVIRDLREWRVISLPLKRRHFGREYVGFIVSPHHVLTKRDGDICHWLGFNPFKAGGHWTCADSVIFWDAEPIVPNEMVDETHDETVNETGDEIGDEIGDETVNETVPLPASDATKEVSIENRGLVLSEVNGLSGPSVINAPNHHSAEAKCASMVELTILEGQHQNQNLTNAITKAAGQGDDLTTYFKRFSFCKTDEEIVSTACDGEIDLYLIKNGDGNVPSLAVIAQHVMSAVRELAAEEWTGRRECCYRVMDKTAKSLNHEGHSYPPVWLKYMMEFKATPERRCSVGGWSRKKVALEVGSCFSKLPAHYLRDAAAYFGLQWSEKDWPQEGQEYYMRGGRGLNSYRDAWMLMVMRLKRGMLWNSRRDALMVRLYKQDCEPHKPPLGGEDWKNYFNNQGYNDGAPGGPHGDDPLGGVK